MGNPLSGSIVRDKMATIFRNQGKIYVVANNFKANGTIDGNWNVGKRLSDGFGITT